MPNVYVAYHISIIYTTCSISLLSVQYVNQNIQFDIFCTDD